MDKAGIEGHKATSRGLRHGFAVQALMTVPITQVQIWLGHAYLQTTSIYAQVSGTEERELAEKLWAALKAGQIPTNVESNEIPETQLSVFPNPITDVSNVQFALKDGANVELNVYSLGFCFLDCH